MSNGPFKEDGFQHYYLRDEYNNPYGVVVVAPGTEPDRVHRGISLCAAMDAWDRHEGRKTAVGRIKKAMGTKASSELISNVTAESVATFAREACAVFIEDESKPDIFKSGYNVPATDKEKVIIENLLKKQEAVASV